MYVNINYNIYIMYIRHSRVAFFILQKLEKYVFGFCLFWSNNNIQSNQNNAIQKKKKKETYGTVSQFNSKYVFSGT